MSVDDTKKCGLKELLMFVLAIIFGTACSITSKVMMEQYSIGVDGTLEKFDKALFQTFGMFIGMLFALPIHWIVTWFRIDFPGYQHSLQPTEPSAYSGYNFDSQNNGDTSFTESDSLLHRDKKRHTCASNGLSIPPRTYFLLAVPSIFDLMATTLCMCGLRFVSVSIYQLLRGSGIVFVALMKQNILCSRLHKFQWCGVFFNALSVTLVGATALLATPSKQDNTSNQQGEAFTGVLFILAGSFVQSLQFVFEERVMSSASEVVVPPLLLIGMEGVWGTFICVAFLYPLAYYLQGSDHGSYEDPFNTLIMIQNSSSIQLTFFLYFIAIFGYNVFAVLVTFMLNSIWHAILDNFRPITVWVVDLIIYYGFTQGNLGESWTRWSFLQAAGMIVLLFGTAIYNAPNDGSIELKGQWWALGADYSNEYQEIEFEREREELLRKMKFRERNRNRATLHESIGPGKIDFTSLRTSFHTLSLRGKFGSSKM